MKSLRGMKKGSGHLEMIVSFTVFTVFTIFLLYYLSPAPGADLSESVLDSLETSFINYTGTEVKSILLSPDAVGCVNINLASYGLTGESTVIKADGSSVDSSFDGTTLEVDELNNDHAYVYFSDEFSDDSASCGGGAGIELGDLRTEIMLSNQSLMELETNYTNNYDDLKTELGLPGAVDFAIYTQDGYLNAKGNEINAETTAKALIIDVVSADGSIEEKVVILQVW